MNAEIPLPDVSKLSELPAAELGKTRELLESEFEKCTRRPGSHPERAREVDDALWRVKCEQKQRGDS